MQAIKDFMLQMLVMMMPVFSPSLIFAMIAMTIAGLVILVVGRDSTVKIGIRFVSWAVLTSIVFLFVLDPIMAMVKSAGNPDPMKSAFAHLAKLPTVGPKGYFEFILKLMPYLVLVITLFVLLFRSAASALGIGRFLLIMGIIFIVCQIMGIWLGLSASINFGDFMNWKNIIVEFWKLGVGMVILGSVLSLLGQSARNRVA